MYCGSVSIVLEEDNKGLCQFIIHNIVCITAKLHRGAVKNYESYVQELQFQFYNFIICIFAIRKLQDFTLFTQEPGRIFLLPLQESVKQNCSTNKIVRIQTVLFWLLFCLGLTLYWRDLPLLKGITKLKTFFLPSNWS